MIREIGQDEGVALSYPDGREVAVYLDEILSPARVRFRVVEDGESVSWTLVEDECYRADMDRLNGVRVCLHDVRSTKRARLRIHAPREVKIDLADARYDEVGEER